MVISTFLEKYALVLYQKAHALLCFFKEFSPEANFLSDIAAFETAIIAFLIPLSIEIISKVSERYQSGVISNLFEDKWENRVLLKALMLNITFAIGLRFIIKDGNNSAAWQVFSWIILVLFLVIAFILLRVVKLIKIYMTDTKYIINELLADAEKSIDEI